MVKIIDTLLGKSAASSDDDYMELDLASYEEHGGANPALLVKIATIADLKDTPRVKDEVYSGNIVIVDPKGHYAGFMKLPHQADRILMAYKSIARKS